MKRRKRYLKIIINNFKAYFLLYTPYLMVVVHHLFLVCFAYCRKEEQLLLMTKRERLWMLLVSKAGTKWTVWQRH